jgi:hypothetical protein
MVASLAVPVPKNVIIWANHDTMIGALAQITSNDLPLVSSIIKSTSSLHILPRISPFPIDLLPVRSYSYPRSLLAGILRLVRAWRASWKTQSVGN